jgi:hypothetical protein
MWMRAGRLLYSTIISWLLRKVINNVSCRKKVKFLFQSATDIDRSIDLYGLVSIVCMAQMNF